MKLYIQFFVTITFFVIQTHCDYFKNLHTREHHAIDSSGYYNTCEYSKFNPCKHESKCYYTNLTSEYFCKCNQCYSGQFCQDKVCDSKNKKNKISYHSLVLSDTIYVSIVGVTFILAIISTLKFSWINDQIGKKIASGEVLNDPSLILNSKNSIVQNVASSINLDERTKNLELEEFIINDTIPNELYNSKDKNNNIKSQNNYNLWDDLKMKLKTTTSEKNKK